ncbi:MAG: hypothetical protein JOY55_08450 [Mycobacterium sp.]|nr:hypothetical protein [Mycobacterium sp.]MBV8291835.1 hypothetical protein [Mycobacterium sp.]
MNTLRSLAAALILAAGLVAVPIAGPAVAHACVALHGRHVGVGGCPGGDIAVGGEEAAIARGEAAEVDMSRPPCIEPDGTPYWTPDGDPC